VDGHSWTLIELIITENKIETRNVSMFILKAFEIRENNYSLTKYAPRAFCLE